MVGANKDSNNSKFKEIENRVENIEKYLGKDLIRIEKKVDELETQAIKHQSEYLNLYKRVISRPEYRKP